MLGGRRTVAVGEGVDGHGDCNSMKTYLRAPTNTPKNEGLIGGI